MEDRRPSTQQVPNGARLEADKNLQDNGTPLSTKKAN